MKKFLFLFLFPAVLFAQTSTGNYERFVRAWSDSGATPTYRSIDSVSFTGGRTDTTEVFTITQYKTIYMTLQSTDSVSMFIKYRMSLDQKNWTAFATLDSLKENSNTPAVKSVDFTSTLLGVRFVQFCFATSTSAYALGTTSPYYWAFITLKKY